MVDDTDTALESHVNGHLVLGDGIHGRGDQGHLEGDALGDGGIEGDGRGGEANVTRKEQEIIVGETALGLGVHEIADVEAITTLVLLEDLHGGGVVQEGVVAVYCHFCNQ